MTTRGSRRRVIAGMSGAQAAAADLLRARAGEAEAHLDQQLLDTASAMFIAFDTFYKSHRMYQEGNPALDRVLTQLESKLRTALARSGEVTVSLTPLALELGGRAVYTAPDRDHNMWFPLYRDGIRELTFSERIDRDQISRFCAALIKLATIKPGSDDDDGEDDAVTLLWDLALEDISYVVIDPFADADDARVAKIREIVTVCRMKELVVPPGDYGRDIELAGRLELVGLNKADLTGLQRDNLAAVDELPVRVREANGNLRALEASERDALARALVGDAAARDEKLLDALVHALIADGGREHGEALCAAIGRSFTALLVAGGFTRATRLRKQVIAAARKTPNLALWSQIDQAMAVDAAIATIVETLAARDTLVARDESGLADVIGLLEVMPAAAARALVSRLGKIEHHKRRPICDVVSIWGAPVVDAVGAALPGADDELALDLLYLLRHVGSEAAAAALDRATRHAVPTIRATALRLFAEIAPGPSLAVPLRLTLRDTDAMVRAAALELAVAQRPAGCERWIKEAIDADRFATLDVGEKTRLFVAYALLGGEQVAAELITRLEQRNLFMQSSIDEERVAVANALGHLRVAAARPALERLAKSKMTRALVRQACTEALAVLDRPPPAQPLPRSETAPPPVAIDESAPTARRRFDSAPPASLDESAPTTRRKFDSGSPSSVDQPAPTARRRVDDALPLSVDDALPFSFDDSPPLVLDDSSPRSPADSLPRSLDDSSPRSPADSLPLSLDDSLPLSLDDSLPLSLDDSLPLSLADAPLTPDASRSIPLDESPPRTLDEPKVMFKPKRAASPAPAPPAEEPVAKGVPGASPAPAAAPPRGALPHVSMPRAPSRPAESAATERVLTPPKGTQVPGRPGTAPVTSRPDTRSAGGRRPVDDGVAVVRRPGTNPSGAASPSTPDDPKGPKRNG